MTAAPRIASRPLEACKGSGDNGECAKDPISDGELTREEMRGALSSLWRLVRSLTSRLQGSPEPSRPAALEGDIARLEDFIETRRKLEALAIAFGYDAAKVTLSPEKKTFDHLGQSFTAEGQAWPDGRIEIYYDPKMSDARMGCCLAHEIQHIKYFVVRSAYRAEPADGPLHRRFAPFTPEILAAQRGVSDYSNDHWAAWKGVSPPKLFSMELEEGQSEPVNETIADVAKALYNWGPEVRINPIWKELQQAIDAEYDGLQRDSL